MSDSVSSSSVSAPPPAVAQTRVNNTTSNEGPKQISIELRRKAIKSHQQQAKANAKAKASNTVVAGPNSAPLPQAKSANTAASAQQVSPSSGEDNSQWLSRVRQVQLSAMTPEQRENLRKKHDEQADRLASAKKLHSIAHRTQNAKTTSYFAMDSGAVNRARQSTALQSAQLMMASPPVPVQPQQQQQQGQPAPSKPQAPSSQSQQANMLMDMMEQDDEAITTSFAVPQRKKAKNDASSKKYATNSNNNNNNNGDDIDIEEVQRLREREEALNAPVFAMKEEQQMTTSVGWNQKQMEGNERVTESEEQAALRSLRQEPATDDERAAKFEIFEKFSNKMMKIRTDLDETVQETVVELPPLPREAVKQSLKKLETEKSRGIYDESRFWFVHDMFVQASKNCDLMNEISDEVARKIRMAANNDQTECPVCLLNFHDENSRRPVVVEKKRDGENDEDEEEEEEEPRVEPVVLSCLHKICEECFEQWKKIKGDRVYCPLCRNEEFLKDIAAAQEIPPL